MKNPRTRFILILGLVLVLAVIAVLPSLLASPSPTVPSSPTRPLASPVARVSQTPGNAFVTPVSAAPTASGVSKPSTVSSFKVTPAPSLIPAGSTQTPLPAATPTPWTTPWTPMPPITPVVEKPTGEKDDVPMVQIPAGEFIMGIDLEFALDLFWRWEKIKKDVFVLDSPNFYYEIPSLHVSLSAYQIDQVKVTTARYQRCVAASECHPLTTEPGKNDSTRALVNWIDATNYCRWVDKRLPTEAEWEKAARGVDGRLYPWGNDWNQPHNPSPYGVQQMIDANEWTNDVFQPYPSNSFELSEVRFKEIKQVRAVRGGYASDVDILSMVTSRQPADPDQLFSFRCVRGAPPVNLASAVTSYRPIVPSTPIPQVADLSNMVSVPAGEFIMGMDEIKTDYPELSKNASPQHRVYLNAFYIDKYEVTNVEYAEFLNVLGQSRRACAGFNCASTRLAGTSYYPVIVEYPGTPTVFRVMPGYERFPVREVTWYGAQAFCAWLGKRLPTEAEWEKAARGTNGQRYPWGDTWDDHSLSTKISSVREVGSDPLDISPYGVVDMLGNAREWVLDWYDPNYYAVSPYRNPQGVDKPSSNSRKIIRSIGVVDLTIPWGLSLRASSAPESESAGLRCAYSKD